MESSVDGIAAPQPSEYLHNSISGQPSLIEMCPICKAIADDILRVEEDNDAYEDLSLGNWQEFLIERSASPVGPLFVI
jgi:hypothetical protein